MTHLDVLVLGAGPVGNYLSGLIAKKFPNASITIADCTSNTDYLSTRTQVNSNIGYSINASRPSLFEGPEKIWGGALMKWPRMILHQHGLTDDCHPLNFLEIATNELIDDLRIPSTEFQPEYLGVGNALLMNAVVYPNREISNLSKYRNIRLKSHVIAKAITDFSDQSVTVEFISASGNTFEIVCSQLLICLGTLETTRFLLSSQEILGINQSLGTNITDHINFSLGTFQSDEVDLEIDRLLVRRSLNEFMVWPRLFIGHEDGPDFFLHFRKISHSKLWKSTLSKIHHLGKFNEIEVMLFAEVMPSPERRVYKDPRAKNDKIVVDFQLGPKDLEVFNRIRESSIDFLRKELGVKGSFLSLNRDVQLSDLEDTRHSAGTTPISDKPFNGVVNQNYQLQNANNVRIIGNSLLPRSSATHPTMTALAFARHALNYFEL